MEPPPTPPPPEHDPVDVLVAKLNPAVFNHFINAVKQNAWGPNFPSADMTRVLEELYTGVTISSGSLVMRVLDTPTAEQRRRLAKPLFSLVSAGEKSKNAELFELRRRVPELEEREQELLKTIDGLKVDLDIAAKASLSRAPEPALSASKSGGDNDDDDDDDDDTTIKSLQPNSNVLYITRYSWAQAIKQLEQWRKTLPLGAEQNAADFVSWLVIQAITNTGALNTLKVLKRSSVFESDFVDPQLTLGAKTPEATRNLLRDAVAAARDDKSIPAFDSIDYVYRERSMTHVVFSNNAWPAVIAALRVYNTDHWCADPIDFLRWLEADDRRRQLLALLSFGAPQDLKAVLGGLPETSVEFFERVVQEAENQLEQNQFQFVPVPVDYVRAQVASVLKVIDEELPTLQAQLDTETLLSTEAYQKALQKIRDLRKQLAIDWLERLSPAAMRALVDDSMANDTDSNRDAVVGAFETMLRQLDTPGMIQKIKWII